MSYRRAEDILPQDILDIIQKYVDGELIYIPRKQSNKRYWGENTDTKQIIACRNKEIYQDYECGMTITGLSEKYFLVEKSIQRILRQEKESNQ